MREDARNFLDNLSQSNFRYQEFENRFYVNSTWKMFSAILHDPRVLDQSICSDPVTIGDEHPPHSAPSQGPASAVPLLERYSPPAPQSQDQRQIDLREFFTRVSEGE